RRIVEGSEYRCSGQRRRRSCANVHVDAIGCAHREIYRSVSLAHRKARTRVFAWEGTTAGEDVQHRARVASRDVHALTTSAIRLDVERRETMRRVLAADARDARQRHRPLVLESYQADARDRVAVRELQLEPRRQLLTRDRWVDAEVHEQSTRDRAANALDHAATVASSRSTRAQRSRAASSQDAKRNVNPLLSNRVGTTRRLFRINSLSVRMRKLPSSTIHVVAGKPSDAPAARRSVRMKSALPSGNGDVMFTAPARCSCAMSQSTERTKSPSWTQDMNCRPSPARPPRPSAARRRRMLNPLRGSVPMTMAIRIATLRVRPVAASANADSHARATSMLNRHALGASGSAPPMTPVSSSFGASARCG